jgi:hypothetical protein
MLLLDEQVFGLFVPEETVKTLLALSTEVCFASVVRLPKNEVEEIKMPWQ